MIKRTQVLFLGQQYILPTEVESTQRGPVKYGAYMFNGVTGLPHGKAWHHV